MSDKERVGAAEVERITGFSRRKVQLLASRGRIPSAARPAGGCWSFDPAVVRAWLKREEGKLCRTTSIEEERPGTPASRSGGATVDEAYERLLGASPGRG